MDDCLLPPVSLDGRLPRASTRAPDGARDNELGESILTPPFLFSVPLELGTAANAVFLPESDNPEGIWEFKISGVCGAGEHEDEFWDEPTTTGPKARCKGRGPLAVCGETMLREYLLALVVEVDDEALAVLDSREDVLGNEKGDAVSVIVLYGVSLSSLIASGVARSPIISNSMAAVNSSVREKVVVVESEGLSRPVWPSSENRSCWI